MLMEEKALRARCSKARYDILRRAKPKMWKTGRLAGRIRVDCNIEYDNPNPNEVSYFRVDTGDLVKTRPLSESERQMEMDLTLDQSLANIEKVFGKPEEEVVAVSAEDAAAEQEEREAETVAEVSPEAQVANAKKKLQLM